MARLVGLRYTGLKKNGINLVLYKSYKTVHLTPLDSYRFSPSDHTSAEACKYYTGLPHHLGVEVILDKELSVHTSAGPRDDNNNHSPKVEEVIIPDDPKDADGNIIQEVVSNDAEVTTEPVDIEVKLEVNGVNLSELTDNELSEYIESNLNREKLIKVLGTLEPDTEVGNKVRNNTLVKNIMNHDHKEIINAIVAIND